MKTSQVLMSLVALSALGSTGALADTAGPFDGAARDAWLTGRIESMYLLNEHLSPFSISTDVENGVVHLTGTVESEIDRDLAAALARNVEGVDRVDNMLVVDAAAMAKSGASNRSGSRRDFGTWVDDATTTAAVKTRLIGNSSTKGLEIDVDTNNDIVTLSGRVATPEEKALAEEVARHTKDVEEVHNNLVVDPS